MKREQQPIDELLIKSLLEETSLSEQIEVNQWLAGSEDHQLYFEHFETIWNHSRLLAAQSEVDEQAAWDRFLNRVQQRGQPVSVMPLKRPFWNIYRVAAVLTIMLGMSWLAYRQMTKSPAMVVLHSGETTLTDTLPDHSIVTLNRHSSISYPKNFSANERLVTLKGEGFFDVTPDKRKPFVITVNQLKVRVVGTSFNVRENAVQTEVVVETGKVEVARQDKKVMLAPKEEVVVRSNNSELVKRQRKDDFYNYYRTRKLVCSGTPLWRLVEILNETHEANIVIENERLKNLPIDTTFDQNSVDSILVIISETLGLNIQRSNGQIILK